jgi:hypothetical protein
MDMMRDGCSVRRFQWWQQWSTMWPVAVFDSVVIAEHRVRQPVVAQELPDVLHHVELGAFRRQRQERDVVGHGESPERCHPA